LATLDDDGGSWTSPVQFQYDASLHLYFARSEAPPNPSLPAPVRHRTAGSTSRSRQPKHGSSTRDPTGDGTRSTSQASAC
jgi:hypothetical protein